MVRLVGNVHRLWTYTATGIVPPGISTDPGFLEGAIRASVNWNDTMLTWLRGTEVREEQVTDEQLQHLMTEFNRRLSGH